MRQVFRPLIVMFALIMIIPLAAFQMQLERYRVQIDKATVYQADDGSPVLMLEGALGTGCEVPVQVEMVRDDTVLDIGVYQLLEPNAICPAILVPYQDSIRLSLDDLNRELTVNGIDVEFDRQTLPPVDESDDILLTIDEFTVERVELLPNSESLPVTLLVAGQKNGGCGDLPTIIEQAVGAGRISIRLYREIPPNIRCSRDLPPFEEPVELGLPPGYIDDTTSAEKGVVVEINDYIGFLEVTGQTDAGMQFQLTAAEREPVTVENVDVHVISGDPDVVVFTVQGILNEGCLRNIGLRMVDGEADYNWEVYSIRLSDPQPLCLAADRTFSEEVRLNAPENAGTYSYDFNGVGGTFVIGERTEDEPTMRIEHAIESVEVVVMESFPEQINLNVSGYIPDGCQAETQIDIDRDGDVFTISIYRELPLAVLCPAIIVDYETVVSLGAIGVGDYTFIVNGVTVTLNP